MWEVILEINNWRKVIQVEDYVMKSGRISMTYLPEMELIAGKGQSPAKGCTPIFVFYHTGKRVNNLPLFEYKGNQ